jgi:hypothetical protein
VRLEQSSDALFVSFALDARSLIGRALRQDDSDDRNTACYQTADDHGNKTRPPRRLRHTIGSNGGIVSAGVIQGEPNTSERQSI